jgi:hypothetical protein
MIFYLPFGDFLPQKNWLYSLTFSFWKQTLMELFNEDKC